MIMATSGIIWTARMPTITILRPRKANREMASAASMPTAIPMTTTDQRHDEAAPDRAPEVGDVQGPPEVLRREDVGEEVRVGVDGVLGRLERRVQHPVDREARGDEDEEAEQIPAELARAGAARGGGSRAGRGHAAAYVHCAHSTSPILSIWRI